MTKTTFFGYSAIIMLVLNVGLTVFLLSERGEKERQRPPHKGPRNEIIEELDFDASQTTAYDALIESHRSSIRQYDQEMMRLKRDLYSSLASDAQPVNQDSLKHEINAVQLQVEQVHYAHFQDIKALCRPDQEVKFNHLADRLAALFAPPKPPKK